MATAQSPLSPTRGSVAPAGLKLRDSCNRCAASKIKCNKKKPTCTRCVKQGHTCEYLVTKRAGRKPGSRVSHHASPPITQDVPTTITTTTTTTVAAMGSTWPTSLLDPDMIQQSPASPPTGYPDILSGASSLGDQTISIPTTLDFNLTDFPTSAVAFSMLDLMDGNDLTGSCHLNHLNDTSNLPDFGRATEPLTPHHLPSSLDAATVPADIPPPLQKLPNTRSATVDGLNSGKICSFARALSLLKDSSSPASLFSHAPAENHAGRFPVPTIQSVMAENEQTVQVISDILQGKGAEDGYLLAVLSVIILRVLARYAAVLRQMPGLDSDGSDWDSPESEQTNLLGNNYCLDSDDCSRKIAQQILSQLHRVQRLVNILSQRFQAHSGRAETQNASRSGSSDGSMFIESFFSFPNCMLGQFENDLRKRLRTLSAEILDMLR